MALPDVMKRTEGKNGRANKIICHCNSKNSQHFKVQKD